MVQVPRGNAGKQEQVQGYTSHFHALVIQLSLWYYCNIFER